MFLTVTLLVKLNLFQITLILSNNTLFPILGALGRINTAGLFFSSLTVAYIVAPWTVAEFFVNTHLEKVICE